MLLKKYKNNILYIKTEIIFELKNSPNCLHYQFGPILGLLTFRCILLPEQVAPNKTIKSFMPFKKATTFPRIELKKFFKLSPLIKLKFESFPWRKPWGYFVPRCKIGKINNLNKKLETKKKHFKQHRCQLVSSAHGIMVFSNFLIQWANLRQCIQS